MFSKSFYNYNYFKYFLKDYKIYLLLFYFCKLFHARVNYLFDNINIQKNHYALVYF